MSRPNTLSVLALSAFTLYLTACTKVEDAPRTVEWWSEHKKELGEKLAWCKNNAVHMATIDCANASRAVLSTDDTAHQYKPPMNWGSPTPGPPAPPKP